MSTPLVSVVIPTCGRPQYLPRAVESALACQGESVEVVAVPNGPDEGWRQSLAPWTNDDRVHVSPIATAHGNVARNHGLSLARGRYVRFLDDDDYLLPEAYRQLEIMERSGADISSGHLVSKDQDGTDLGSVGFPDTHDFVVAATSISGFTLPTGNLFRRDSLVGCRWDERVDRAQDNAWMLDLATLREWDWVHLEQPVGVWFQHRLTRTSSTQRLTGRETAIVRRLLTLPKRLGRQGRLSPERTYAVAQALWFYIHRGFPNHPCYWSSIARAALSIDDSARPAHSLFKHDFVRSMNPLWAERCLLPARIPSQLAKGILEATGYQNHRRTL